MKIETLSKDPEILLLRDFISRDEAACLLRQAEGHFGNSRVTCTEEGGCVSDYRTSSTAYLPQTKVGELVAKRGLAFAKLGFAEDLQIVRYFPGQQFKPHLDAFDPGTFEGRKELAGFGGRQRDVTLLIYLNKPLAGGATRFTTLGLDVEPEPGAALFWRNVGADGKIDSRTMHAGLPVGSGVKFAINLWLRGAKALAGFHPSAMLSREHLTGRRNFVFLPIGERLGKLGEFKPSTEEDSKKFNLPIERQPYSGTPYTLTKMAAYIREGSISPSMRQFAEMVIKNAGVDSSVHLSNSEAAQTLLTYVKKNVRYRPDPDNMEFVQSPFVTLCVPGAQMCIPIEDCDGLCVALGSLMGAYGIPVRIMKQTFGDDAEEEHVLIVFKTDDGKWLPADPSAPLDRGVGWMAKDSSHLIVDPLDPQGTGTAASEFVAIGSLKSKFELTLSQGIEGNLLPPKQILKALGSSSTHDQAVALQTRLSDLSLATALAIEECCSSFRTPATATTPPSGCVSKLTDLQQAQWSDLAQRILTFVSADPDTVDLALGATLSQELVGWGDILRAAGCSAPIPAPIPVPAPAPSGGETSNPWPEVAKLGLWVALAGVGAYGLAQVVEIVKVTEEIGHHLKPAASEAKRLVRGRRRAA